ncbi:hypothetical protein GCM10008955_41450 [Deinococcus malanensis]|uniref:Uncharacterized protein n=1 Tax=Deinococcus malanensis TaxID=1706855 RepID=A0ABQ2F561_9DEIO|nr:hypothetical protein [Deinococcus malanensis]GGK43432.1 hypothetical protein GCM10008955_41450 [Deinococcus malanensis]
MPQRLDILLRSVSHQNQEFVATHPEHLIGLTRLFFQGQRDFLQDPVTFQVSMLVIHFFEVVEIQENQGEGIRTLRLCPYGV